MNTTKWQDCIVSGCHIRSDTRQMAFDLSVDTHHKTSVVICTGPKVTYTQ